MLMQVISAGQLQPPAACIKFKLHVYALDNLSFLLIPLTYSFPHSFIHLLTYPLTHLLTHLHTHKSIMVASFLSLPSEIRIMIHTHVFACGSIFPYQNDIPVDKNGVRHETVCHAWLMAMALLRNPIYRFECEEVLWSTNLVVFNGYTIRRFFSILDQLRGLRHQAEVLTTLRKGWIKRVSVHFNNADRDYMYAVTERNPVEKAECDGINFKVVVNEVNQKTCYAAVSKNCRFNDDGTRIEEKPTMILNTLDLVQSQLIDLGYELPLNFLYGYTTQLIIETITQWVLQARRLAEMQQLDYLEVDVEHTRPLSYSSNTKLLDAVMIGVCGKLVQNFGNAKRVVCCGAWSTDEIRLFSCCYPVSGEDKEQRRGNDIEYLGIRGSSVSYCVKRPLR